MISFTNFYIGIEYFYNMGVLISRFSTMFNGESMNALTVEHGTISTYKHSYIIKIFNSYGKICESSCCFLAAGTLSQ
jgi:hypothetical protein